MSEPISKAPPKGTPLSVIVETPAGARLMNVRVEAIAVDIKTSQPDRDKFGRPTPKEGRVDFSVLDDKFDDISAFERDPANKVVANPPLGADECLINLVATLAGFGAVNQPAGAFQVGNVFAQVRLVKGKDTFGPNSPVIMKMMEKCLFDFPDPGLTDTPARNLTQEQARNILVFLHRQGSLNPRDGIRMQPEPRFDATCKTILSPKPTDRIVINGNVAGVQFFMNLMGSKNFNAKNSTITQDGKQVTVFASSPILTNLDVRNVVGLFRLTKKLRDNFQVSEFHHAGIGQGKGPATDCHNEGRAIDFVGVRLPDPVNPGDTFLIYLAEDWAAKSVPDISEVGKTPKTKPRQADWPSVTQTLEFRLASLDTAAVEAKKIADLEAAAKKTGKPVDPVAVAAIHADRQRVDLVKRFFPDFYRFCAEDYQDKTQDTSQSATDAMSSIGEGSSIMNPDHSTSKPGTSNGREAHRGHVHMQIGLTDSASP